VALCYGPLIAAGTFLVQRGRWPSEYVPLFAVLGLLIAAFLWINEFPDYRADLGAGKRNLVVRLGRPRAARAFALLVAAAVLAVALLPASGLPRTVWLGGLFAPLAVGAAVRLLGSPEDTARVVPAQAWMLISFLLYSIGSGAGLLLAP
jgi:1,4-dihydroxy-2-naphthoate octaprenyltransferase